MVGVFFIQIGDFETLKWVFLMNKRFISIDQEKSMDKN